MGRVLTAPAMESVIQQDDVKTKTLMMRRIQPCEEERNTFQKKELFVGEH